MRNRYILLVAGFLFLCGCARISSPGGVMTLKELQDNQKQMQAQLSKEEMLYERLKADLSSGRLKKAGALKNSIFKVYGEPALCRPAEGQEACDEVCIYRRQTGGGMFGEIMLLNFDSRGRLVSWQGQD